MHPSALQLPATLRLQHFNNNIPIAVDSEISSSTHKPEISSGLKTKLKLLAESDKPAYTASFISAYLLLKLNNLATYQGEGYRDFVRHLSLFYNDYLASHAKYVFKQSQSDSQLTAQILLASETYRYLEEQQLEAILDSCGLVVASMVECYLQVTKFLEKDEYAITMSLVGLYARLNPFISIVHKDKNHKGECDFAAKIYEYMQLDPNVHKRVRQVPKPALKMVQDAYSLRCSPQVYGVVYDCLYELEERLQLSLNKPQFRFITLNGVKLRNLSYRSEMETLMIDSLVFSLNEIGHMSFLRSQRLLNSYLTQNNIEESPFFQLFKTKLKKLSYHVVHNKALAAPTNADTVLMDNYKHDIYVDEGNPHMKMRQMLANLTQLMQLEIMEAVEVLSEVYGKAQRLFRNNGMEGVYRRLLAGKGRGYEEWQRVVREWVQE